MREKLLRQEEASELIRVPVRTLEGWRSHGLGPPFIKFGRHIFYRESDLDAFLERSVIRPSEMNQPEPNSVRRANRTSPPPTD